ncbi:Protein of unknown function UPF0179 [Methanocaldococcus infernus ME]|uniref:UPF0179 protein Metin_1058 n=1 Tax=Methanocaldococcus infernus (strain DSM 11812 / JCM 15783 / ME) TaxID=573063 RepID=D5VT13_METIM|nr:UPF0179 family protein [Methanocaldococcus infernus]ADG13716.1 Protein of unknown function UPF0179 [Methanocaldococcus infernus ME]
MITLIGSKLAKEGEKFIYLGELEECKDCKFKNLCHNLEVGRIYKIKSVRSTNHRCKIHLGGVKAVEVEISEIEAIIESKKALEGLSFTYSPILCDNSDCENYKFCVPQGLVEGDKVRVEKVLERVECKNNLSLRKVILRLI